MRDSDAVLLAQQLQGGKELRACADMCVQI